MSILWIIISYLVGSIPFGYLITKFSSNKNILKIGWRKTSGSNVYKNIGKWQGLLTAFLDVAKGFLVVWLAQKFDLSLQVQALSGAFAVIGHNWSCFLKFAGGRGIGTIFGVILAMSLKISGLMLIPFLVLTIIWNTSVATIVALIFIIILAIYFNQFVPTGFFVAICLFPVFIKRLSPIDEIKKSQKKSTLIINRLIIDDDILNLEPRIKRIIKRLTKK